MITEKEHDAVFVRQLATGPETTVLEFKRRVDRESLAKVISAFANTDGGILLVGVTDRGEIVGCDTASLRYMVYEVTRDLTPPQQVSYQEVFLDDKFVGVVEVEKSATTPVMFEGQVLTRDGQMIRAMHGHELLHHMINQEPEQINAVLAEFMETQSIAISGLRLELRNAHSWTNKLAECTISGIIGAVIGMLLGLVIKQ